SLYIFLFTATATTEIHTLSLHDALPISLAGVLLITATRMVSFSTLRAVIGSTRADTIVFFVTALITVSFDLIEAVEIGIAVAARSEEHTSELQSRSDLVCRLLLEKKNNK